MPSNSATLGLPVTAVRDMGWRGFLWLGILIAGSVAFSLGFACAAPLAAFAAAAALTLNRTDALWLVGGVWLANQAVGFSILGYPWEANTLAWGVVLGVSPILASFAVQWALPRYRAMNRYALAASAFALAFVVYELVLLVAAVTALGGIGAFAPMIVLRILAINACAFVGLLILHQIGMTIGLAPRPALASAQAG